MAKKLTSILALAAVVAMGATASAQAPAAAPVGKDPISQRQALLKEMGKATAPVGDMLQGKAPFDLAKAQAALTIYQKNAPALAKLFPAGTERGVVGKPETEALPAIWETKESKTDFEGRFMKLAADAKTASAAVTDEASFKASFPTVLGDCGGCHKIYRYKK